MIPACVCGIVALVRTMPCKYSTKPRIASLHCSSPRERFSLGKVWLWLVNLMLMPHNYVVKSRNNLTSVSFFLSFPPLLFIGSKYISIDTLNFSTTDPGCCCFVVAVVVLHIVYFQFTCVLIYSGTSK